MVGKDLGLMGSDRNFAAARIGFLGSDPNSGRDFRAGHQSTTDLGSDPNNPDPNNPGSFNPFMSSALASNCVVLIDRLLFVFILAPLSPPALVFGVRAQIRAAFGLLEIVI